MAPVATRIELVQARTARARLLGGELVIRMPLHWGLDYQAEVVERFRRWAARRLQESAHLPLAPIEGGQRWGEADFGRYVAEVNAQTLRAPLKGVRIGRAKHSRLAQANPRTGVLTFSRYAIDGMPVQALRYLVLHELAHLFEANHSPRFWALVAAHEPDHKLQRRIAQAHHARMVAALPPAHQPTRQASTVSSCVNEAPADCSVHPFGGLFSFVPPSN